MSKQPSNKFKNALLIMVVACLFIPLSQTCFNWLPAKPLGGDVEVVADSSVSMKTWFTGDYQKNKEKYIDYNFGTRNFLVRLNNQMDFWLFNKLHAKDVVCGKNNMLFESPYIDAYYGVDFPGEAKVDTLIGKVKRLQDKLQAQNKTLLVVFAPSKARVYSENIPNAWIKNKTRNNYEGFIDALNKYNVNYIDFNKWFLQMKEKSPYPLFTKLGIHWSLCGSAIAFDSIVSYVEKKRNIDMPEFLISKYETPDTLRYPDNDIFVGSNLLFAPSSQKTAYPVFQIKDDSTKTKPVLLTIGDSFWWNIQNTAVGDFVFKEGKFWYYNRLSYPESFTINTAVEALDFNAILNKTDVVVLCYSELTMPQIGNGFMDKSEKYFSDPSNQEAKTKIKNLIEYIKGNKEWMEKIRIRAKKENKSIDSLIIMDATWQVMFN